MFGSKTSARALAAGFALAAAMVAGGAQAATHMLNLSGSAFDITTDTFTFDGVTYETGTLELSGFTPFTLADGDTIEATVNITSGPLFPFIVPSRDQMFFGLNFSDISGGAQPITSTANGTFAFDGAGPVNAGCGNCTSLIYGQNGGTLFFTSLAASGSFTMDSPYEINSITVSYQVNNTGVVPEPASWALMITGFGGAGAMLRRSRRSFVRTSGPATGAAA